MRAYRKVDDQFVFRLDGGRLALLGVGAVLVLVLIFLLGVLVGKSLWGGRRIESVLTVPPAATPAVPDPPLEPAVPKPELSFYDDLKRDGPSSTPEPGAGHAPEATDSSVSRIPAARSEPTTPVPEGSAAPATSSPPAVSPAPAEEGRPKPAAVPPPPKRTVTAAVFSVQVGSFQSVEAARGLAREVEAQGVSARVVEAAVAGRTWYRVQVGNFSARADAEAYYRKNLKPKGIQGFVTTQ